MPRYCLIPVHRRYSAFSKHDDVRKYYIEGSVYEDCEPDHHTEASGEIELQHEGADAELEGGHRSEVEYLPEPQVLQILCGILRGD